MGYIYEKKIQFSQVVYTARLFKQAINKDMSFNAFQRSMQDRNLSYKRLDMLADWNRAKVVERSPTVRGRSRLVNWYDNVALPTMKAQKITPTQFFGPTIDKDPSDFEDSDEYLEWLEWLDQKEEDEKERYGRAF